jgi:hypothetical protein
VDASTAVERAVADVAADLAVALARLTQAQLLELTMDLAPDERAALALALRRLNTRAAVARHEQRAARAGVR